MKIKYGVTKTISAWLSLTLTLICSITSAVALEFTAPTDEASGPETLYDPCLTLVEAKKLISNKKNAVLIFPKKQLHNIIKNNQDALNKLKLIHSDLVMVIPRSHFDLSNGCKNGSVQVYFAYIDTKSEHIKNYYDRNNA